MTAAARAQLGAPQLAKTPLFESDCRCDGKCRGVPVEAILNKDSGNIVIPRAVAWCPGSPR
jgi:hypothetical protein